MKLGFHKIKIPTTFIQTIKRRTVKFNYRKVFMPYGIKQPLSCTTETAKYSQTPASTKQSSVARPMLLYYRLQLEINTYANIISNCLGIYYA